MGEAALDVTVLAAEELTPEESGRLAQLERIIEDNMAAYIAIGMALAEIRDSGLYRATHPTFEAYCRDRFEVSRRRAYQVVEASLVARRLLGDGGDVKKITQTPNEAQARILAKVPEEKQADVWRDACDCAARAGKKPTAKLVSAFARNAESDDVNAAVTKAENKIHQAAVSQSGPAVSMEFAETFAALGKVIRLEAAGGWKLTSKHVVLDALEELTAQIRK